MQPVEVFLQGFSAVRGIAGRCQIPQIAAR